MRSYAADVGDQSHFFGIIVVGALLQIGHGGWVSFLSFVAVLIPGVTDSGWFCR